MLALWIVLGIITGLTVIFFSLLLLCFVMTFYSKKRTKEFLEKYKMPPGKIYLKYKDNLISTMKTVRAMPCEKFQIKSFDNLTLCGRYYETKKGAPIELMIHGYRGNSETDLSAGVLRAMELGHNVLLVDNRASGYSDGHVITFGVNESKDCLAWVDFIIHKFGKDIKILLTGISMGASTVMIAAGNENLPSNVIGVVADCGYTSGEEIIKKVIRKMHLPVKLFYPLIYLSARIFGRFNLNDASAINAMRNCKIPIVFFHTEKDAFVPAQMSRENYEACTSTKKYLSISPEGEHGMCYILNKNEYLKSLKKLRQACGLTTNAKE